MFHKYLLLGQKNSVGAGTERERESRLKEDEENERGSKKGGEKDRGRKEGYIIIHHAQGSSTTSTRSTGLAYVHTHQIYFLKEKKKKKKLI